MTSNDEHTPDDGLDQALRDLFASVQRAEREADTDHLSGLLFAPPSFHQIEAELIDDHVLARELMSVRSSATLGAHQIVAEAGSLVVVVDVLPVSDRYRMFGDVVSTDEPMAVQLLIAGREVGLTVTDGFGEFGFDELQAGMYELVVAGSQVEITISVAVG